MHLNVDVITQKQEIIEIFLGEEQPDIFLVSEFGLTSSQAPQFSLEGYSLKNFRSREQFRKGGVAIYIKNLIEPRLQSLNILNIADDLSQDLHFEAAEISFLADNKKIIVSDVYLSPDGDENPFLHFLRKI